MGAVSTTFTTEEQLQIAAIAGQLRILASGGGSAEQFQSIYDQLEELKNSLLGTEGNLSDEEQARHDSLLSKILEIEARLTVGEQDRYSQIMKAISDLASKIENKYYPQIAAKLSGIETKIDNLDYNSTTPVSQLTYAIPTIEETFTYNGQVQTPILRNFRNTIMTIIPETSTTSATNAGEYKITVRIADGFQWEDETNEDKEISWAIQKATVSIPALSGTFTYNGQEQKPAITNFRDDVSSILTDTSVLAATNAGNYNINVKLNDPDNYTWTDGTTENKTLAWQVAKAASVLSLSANSGSVNYSGTSTFRVASQTGDGALSVTSANTNCVTATISDATITLSGVKANSDATVITVTKAETQNYAGATATYNCVVNKISAPLYVDETLTSFKNFETQYNRTLTDSRPTQYFVFINEGDGELSAQITGADPEYRDYQGEYVSLSFNGKNGIYVTGNAYLNGTFNVKITRAEGVNYKAATHEFEVGYCHVKTRLTVPTFKTGSLYYNGNSQSADDTDFWDNYDPSVMAMSGTTSAVNAGTYSVTFTAKNTEKYSLSNTAKNWSIKKFRAYGLEPGGGYSTQNVIRDDSGRITEINLGKVWENYTLSYDGYEYKSYRQLGGAFFADECSDLSGFNDALTVTWFKSSESPVSNEYRSYKVNQADRFLQYGSACYAAQDVEWYHKNEGEYGATFYIQFKMKSTTNFESFTCRITGQG